MTPHSRRCRQRRCSTISGVNIQLLSDLHLESNPHYQPRPLPGADVLVLAGDIGSYQKGSLLGGSPAESDFGLARFSPLPVAQGGAAWPTPVLFVPGNHEYDALDFDEAHARLRESCARLGLIWLERQTIVLHGVRFVGTTLWSDFDALEQLRATGGEGAGETPERLKRRDKAYRAANFYLRKTATTRAGQPMLAEQIRQQALPCQAWLRQTLARPYAGPTVVVTHFAPSLLSADPRYGLTPGTAGFCNSLDDLLPSAVCWLHGHLHCPSNYLQNGCRVIANPLGYARKGEQDAHLPDMLIRIDTLPI